MREISADYLRYTLHSKNAMKEYLFLGRKIPILAHDNNKWNKVPECYILYIYKIYNCCQLPLYISILQLFMLHLCFYKQSIVHV